MKPFHRLRRRHWKGLLHSTFQLPLLFNLSVTIAVPVASVTWNWRCLLTSTVSGLPALQQLVTTTPNTFYAKSAYVDSGHSSGAKKRTLAIGQLQELTSLKLIGSLLSEQTALDVTRQLTSLQALHLSDTLLPHAQLAHMLRAAPHLTRLALSEVQGYWQTYAENRGSTFAKRERVASCGVIASAIGSLADLQVL